ncbi:kinase-like domain-containing protein [Russula earlei]|uniref:Kinase-like domain-containing protein n=1 Tax=Russula earlei TaxID=71964 RepID=A0ACC0U8P0_9AGAM|nr:kinase-like domain-containing protein [Russula earlei]
MSQGQQATQFDLTTPKGVLAYLAPTPFASSRAESLSGGLANFIFRLHLNTPYEGRPTLVLKHARPYAASSPDFPLPVSRQEYEVDALNRVRAFDLLRTLPPTTTTTARASVPAIHHFDNVAAAIVMDDAGAGSLTLKAALLAGRIAPQRAASLGAALGTFLRALHARGRAEARRDVARAGRRPAGGGGGGGHDDDDDDDDGGRDRRRLVSVLGDEPLGVREETLRVVEALAERRATQIRESRGDDAFLMGDFWPGNVLVGGGGGKEEEEEEEEEGEEGAAEAASPRALVVDWELAKVGLAGLDEAAGEALKSFVRAYFAGDVGPKADEVRRVALGHFGVHLAVWTPRTGWGGGAGPTRALMLDGVARLTEGADADRIWTDEELIQNRPIVIKHDAARHA